jgi:hypothetical protein
MLAGTLKLLYEPLYTQLLDSEQQPPKIHAGESFSQSTRHQIIHKGDQQVKIKYVLYYGEHLFNYYTSMYYIHIRSIIFLS